MRRRMERPSQERERMGMECLAQMALHVNMNEFCVQYIQQITASLAMAARTDKRESAQSADSTASDKFPLDGGSQKNMPPTPALHLQLKALVPFRKHTSPVVCWYIGMRSRRQNTNQQTTTTTGNHWGPRPRHCRLLMPTAPARHLKSGMLLMFISLSKSLGSRGLSSFSCEAHTVLGFPPT